MTNLKIFLLFLNLYFVCSMELVITAFDDLDFNLNSENEANEEENPDEYLTTPQIIRRHGYASESHVVETKDGYLLTIHRISTNENGEKGGQPVFLQHGLLASSADWVISDNNSLAFILADAGYDVWMGNARGNFYSTGHKSFLPSSVQYWNFTFHEMGIYDIPAALSHVSNITGKGGDIIYIGHSMGTTMFFIFSSLLPKTAQLIKVMVGLGPAAYMTHIRSPVRYLAPFSNDLEWLAKQLGLKEFLPRGKILWLLARECEALNYSKDICENVIFILCGFDKEQLLPKQLPLILSHDPAGASTKTLIHYAQEIRNEGNFQCFDYGREGNLRQYGTEAPPLYNVTNIQVPTYLMYGDNDLMADSCDVQKLASQLPKNAGTYEVPLKTFNHVDFLWAKDVASLVYKPMLNFLQNYTSV